MSRYPSTRLEFSSDFQGYLADAAVRLSYLHPALAFTSDGTGISVTGPDAAVSTELLRDVRYSVYRAKIDTDAASLRDAMFRALFG